MSRYPYRKAKKPRPTLAATVGHPSPSPSRTRGGIGWEHIYPAAAPCRHEYPEPCDPPAPYAAVRAKAKPNGKRP